MTTSESIKELAAALAKAQATMGAAKKDVTNTFFKSKYADLAACWEVARAALPAQGLCVVQTTRPSDKEEVIVITRLVHESGEWIESELALPVSKADAQGFGSALTYARRYSLSAMVGIAAEDDDGNLAAAAKPETRPNTATQVAVDALEAMPPEEQKFLREQAASVIHLFEIKGDMAGWIAAQNFDAEEKLGLWSLLPSNVRSAIKLQQKQAANHKPALAEQA